MTTRTICLSLLPILASLALSCAGQRAGKPTLAFHPAGPGVVYDSVESAAVDGLAYAHQLASENDLGGLMHGGTVYAVPGGFTYDEVERASADRPLRLEHRLGRRTVAQFHTYPRTGDVSQNRLNEKPSRSDRRTVDRKDPLHRPVFILTPKLMVRAYHGRTLPIQNVAYIGSTQGPGMVLAGQPSN